MKSDRSKSEVMLKNCKKESSIDKRVKNFISRQLEREKSSKVLNTDSPSFNYTAESSDTLITTSIKSSKSNLKDLKKFKEILRSQLNNKSSYTTNSVLKKVTKKCEEVEKSVKLIENKSKELKSIEKNLESKLLLASSSKDLTKAKKFESLNSTFSTLQLNKSSPDIDLVKRRIIFEEDEQDNEEIKTPEFLNTKSIQLKPGFSAVFKPSNTSPSSINFKTLKRSEVVQPDHIQQKLQRKKHKIRKLEAQLICSSILNALISDIQDTIYMKEKNNLEILQERIKSELNDITIYQNTILSHHTQRNQELNMKEKEIKKKESQILYQLKLLAQEKTEKLVQFKIEQLEKKEEKIREKQLRLLELKEFLVDKEEELVQREAFLRVRYSSVYKEIDADTVRGRLSEESWNQGFWRRNSEIGELYKSVCEKDSDIVAKTLGFKGDRMSFNEKKNMD